MLKYTLTALLGCLLLVPTTFAQEEELPPDEMYDKIEQESQDLMTAFQQKAMEVQQEVAKEGGGQDAMMKAMLGLQTELQEDLGKITGKMLEVARQVEADPETSFRAIEFILIRSEEEACRTRATDILMEHHLENDKLQDLITNVTQGGMPSKGTQVLLESVIAKSDSRETKAATSLALAGYYESLGEMIPMILEQEEQIASVYPEMLEYAKSMKDKIGEDAYLAQLKSIAEEYGDVEHDGELISDTIGSKIKMLETRANVAVGKVAPDIEGPDIDDVEFKLSDYRGKVVMLDFWGDW